MLIFLVIFSLSLNILAFMLIAILFLRQNKLIKLEDRLNKPIKEMEELTTAYLLQMKEENDRFIKRLNQVKKGSQKSEITPINDSKLVPNVEEHSNQSNLPIDQLELQVNDVSFKKTIRPQAVKAYQKQKQNERVSVDSDQLTMTVEQSHQANDESRTVSHNDEEQITHLKEQGYSIEEIAKKLNKGKTEIELLLKFKGKHSRIT